MRKAGDKLREKILSKNKESYIGRGSYGVVYPSDVTGNVMKEWTSPDMPGQNVLKETDLQAIAAELGAAPRIAGVETFPNGAGNRLEMQDIRRNFEPAVADATNFPADPVTNIIL